MGVRDLNERFERAVRALVAGEPVVFPTDTVYGIGVAVRHAATPEVLYDIKKRDAGKPVAWLVEGPDALVEFGADVPGQALELARRHWPGALTVIVKAGEDVPAPFRSQAGTIGMRMPANQTALSLMRAVGCPLATTSANVSGGTDPREFAEIDPCLLEAVPVALEDDLPRSGTASTVLDCSGGGLVVVRQGDLFVPDAAMP